MTALAFQLLVVALRTQWPGWKARFSKKKTVADVCVLRFEAALLFTNARRFARAVRRALRLWNAQGLGLVSLTGAYR